YRGSQRGLIEAKHLAADEGGKVLVWTGETAKEGNGKGRIEVVSSRVSAASAQFSGSKLVLECPVMDSPKGIGWEDELLAPRSGISAAGASAPGRRFSGTTSSRVRGIRPWLTPSRPVHQEPKDRARLHVLDKTEKSAARVVNFTFVTNVNPFALRKAGEPKG